MPHHVLVFHPGAEFSGWQPDAVERPAVASDYEDEEEEAAASESECSVPFDRREMDNKQTMDKFWKSKKQEWEL